MRSIAVLLVLVLFLMGGCVGGQAPQTTPPAQTTAPSVTGVPTTTAPPVTTAPPTTAAPTTAPPTTTPPPVKNALYIPEGQSLRGAIQVRGSNTYYSVDTATLRAYGGAPLSGYTWSVDSLSALPPGTAVDPLTGIFHWNGGKLLPGTHTFKMVVSDGSKTATGTFSFVVNTGEIVPVAVFQQPALSTIPLPDANAGVGYGASLWAFGKDENGNDELPWSWHLGTGELPPGLVIDPSRGIVRGTPFSSAAGNTYMFTIIVKDKTGKEAVNIGPGLKPPTYTISVHR